MLFSHEKTNIFANSSKSCFSNIDIFSEPTIHKMKFRKF
jgi:hypothetical protein